MTLSSGGNLDIMEKFAEEFLDLMYQVEQHL